MLKGYRNDLRNTSTVRAVLTRAAAGGNTILRVIVAASPMEQYTLSGEFYFLLRNNAVFFYSF